MKWIKSFLHKGIINNNLKRFVWAEVSYFVVLILLLPMRVLMTLPSIGEVYFYDEMFNRIYEFGGEPFQLFLMLTAPFVVGILMFQYLQQKSPSDFLHSIPLTRRTLFWSQLFSGFALWAVPVLLIGGISFIVKNVTTAGQFLSAGTIWQWIGTTLLMNTVIYLSTITVGMFSGVVLAQGIFTYILLLLPAGLLILVAYNLNTLLFGFSEEFLLRDEYLLFSPIFRIFRLFNESLTVTEVWGYLVACLIMVGISRMLYQYRPMERCRQTVVFSGINQIFLLGITFCFMLTGGLYAQATSNGGILWLLLAYFIFAMKGHFIALAVLNKSFRIFNRKNAKSFAIYLGVTGLILAGIVTDVTGYEQRIPHADEVEEAFFDWSFHRYENDWYQSEIDYMYRQPESIEAIVDLHEAIIRDGGQHRFNGNRNRGNTWNVALAYHLKEGGRQVRQYEIPYDDYEAYIRPIRELAEDKMMEYPVLRLQAEDVSHMEFQTEEMGKRKILQREESEEVLEILQREILRADYDVLHGDERPEGAIRIFLTDSKRREHPRYHHSDVYVSRSRRFEELDQWLKDNGHYDDVTLVPSDVHQVSVQMVQTEEEMERIQQSNIMAASADVITRETGDIEESLKRFSSIWRSYDHYPVYAVGFFDENDNQLFVGTFEPGNLPEFVYVQ